MWHMAFPMLVLLLVTSKVWSPQYALWLLPWFALSSVPTMAFVQYQLGEVLVFFVRFLFFGDLAGGGGASYEVLAAVSVIRAFLLIRCLALWMRKPAFEPDFHARDAVGSPLAAAGPYERDRRR
jgi:hypothetical protein